ncbi:MAG: phosphoribosylaminoimidazolesuccinocarboxamide synthase [Candidatus Aenigmarchaeota archaeon]|nr:phosphoribosylaminoimidazolesuccinocarboxamide synthase [Candidatus Aenigmarchaeota archaeon]
MKTICQTRLPAELHSRGKVRDNYIGMDGTFILVTTYRISAFDRVLPQQIPGKGQCLNESSRYTFENSRDIVPNHYLASPHPNVMVAQRCEPVELEVIARGYLSGSAWRTYEKGQRRFFGGVTLTEGLKKNQNLVDVLGRPILTPTTKAKTGHDEYIDDRAVADEVARGRWDEIEDAAFRLFARANEMAGRNGYSEADTKYEFGLRDGKLFLIDEANTHDSSRFFRKATYGVQFQLGKDLDWIDKEYVRIYLTGLGWTGDGPVPDLPSEIVEGAQRRLLESVKAITGRDFVPVEPREEEMIEALRSGGYV